jgi:organic radical activating enzyme
MKTYKITEIFYAPQGEGVRAGTMNVFVRFAGCNLTCQKASHGFDCDTYFASGRTMTSEELLTEMEAVGGSCRHAILTGGEPLLQVDPELIALLKLNDWRLAIETNGSGKVPAGFDWITVSPKVAEHAIQQVTADEVKYVLHHGQALPKTVVKADHYLLSPAWEADGLPKENLQWCLKLCQEHPQWRLSVQLHKLWASR